LSAGPSSICVIFNPAAGRRRAQHRLEAISTNWRSRAAFWPTERAGHAVELARRASLEGFEFVAAAGGDGTVHEVANGLLQASRPEVGFVVLPLGSADDYAYSLRQDIGDPGDGQGRGRLVDVGVVRTGRGQDRYFLCCLGLGFGPCVTIESQAVGWLQGRLLYGFAALRAMWRRWGYLDLTGSLDGQPLEGGLTLTASVMIGRREGGFIMAPQARLDDGWFDLVQAGKLTRWEALRLIPRLSFSGPPRDHPKLRFLRGRRLVIESQQPVAIHVDGEVLHHREDQVHHIEVELIPRRLLVRLGFDGIGE
jgi:diacylglycerol kinase (ATP)